VLVSCIILLEMVSVIIPTNFVPSSPKRPRLSKVVELIIYSDHMPATAIDI